VVNGSVAAPTAGLHFTEEILENLGAKGIRRADITLHVGAGTFQPVRSKTLSGHEMHSEHFFFSRETITSLLVNKKKIIAVGTTSVRTLESMYWLGVKVRNHPGIPADELRIGQWEPYENSALVPFDESLTALSEFMKSNGLSAAEALTQLIIVPGYEFRVIDAMITNFHQPKSTLLLLVSAWTGNKWSDIYDYAIRNDFRFLSYGDSSLLFRS
jgi:S-adenosylmethionine:tRNA ribosyltransferase-isomerase